MSDNESDEEQHQQMEELFICADIWLEVFAFIDPFEIGLKMALISERFDALVDVHFKSRKWSLGSMTICRGGNGAQIVNNRSGERLPIPQGRIPNAVIGFECIQICYVDQTVIKFLQHILNSSSGTNVAIYTSDDQSRSWEIIWQNIWPLANDNICSLRLGFSDLDRLRQFSPAILRNCANLRSIHYPELFPEFPAEDNAAASPDQALAKWLLTPRGHGLPKMLHCGFYTGGMEELQGAFANASEPANFIIRLRSFAGIKPFELNNNWTGEKLKLGRFDKAKWLLVRCPIGREEAKWAKWEKEAIEWKWRRQWNRISINLEDSGICDGMAEANEGPSKHN